MGKNITIDQIIASEKIIGEVLWKGEIRKLFLIDKSRMATENLVRCMYRDSHKRRCSFFVKPEEIIEYL